MQLPFSEAEFLEVFGHYNRALWPGALVLWLASAAAAVDWLGARRLSDRWLAGFLALHWAWVGVFYHGVYFSRINPAAWLFAALFLVQAALLLWFGCHRRSLTFTVRSGAWRGIGAALVVYSLVYPVLPWALGFRYPEMPTFGVPCPTTLFTAGFLVAASSPALCRLLVVPAAWCLVGASAAFLFGVYPDWALLLALPLLLVRGLFARRWRSAPRS
jgi:hypothetical protein